ncbi:uncharacterized protein LOC125553418 [Triticum urartu]|uniref:uncharacterized protein LOC125553418 n=1 Tax=Triticum urartu TaxID=4572 RepID=UPI0020432CFA|nr:uncharacterized protein LOC125553418 [Triticum urartu]
MNLPPAPRRGPRGLRPSPLGRRPRRRAGEVFRAVGNPPRTSRRGASWAPPVSRASAREYLASHHRRDRSSHRQGSSDMSGGIRRQFLNLGLFDERNRAYSLRRLDLSKMDFFHRTAQEAATHGKVVPTLTPAKACAPNRRRICKTDLATAEAAAPKINPPKSELFVRPLEVSYSIRSPCCLHFLPTASESKVISADHANRMLRFDTIDGCS